jgi:hypothetical protein
MTNLAVRMLAVAVLLMQSAAIAHTKSSQELCHFLPENNLNIPVGMERFGGIDERTFNNVIDKISSFYEPIIQARGGKLKVNRLWDNGTVNASAQRQGSTYVLNMYGGLARHSRTTEDGFALVMCHEMGHHLGGFPTSGGILSINNWASNEGQSDYFATMKCFRRVYENEDNASVVASLDVPETVLNKCSQSFKSKSEINLCVRGTMAGQVLANLLWGLSNGEKELRGKNLPSVDTPNTNIVIKTDNAHPEAQCRLDTYFAGAICPVHFSEDFGKKDPLTGACATEKGDRFGYRPLCWYKPKN